MSESSCACGTSSGSGSGHTALAGAVGRGPDLVAPAVVVAHQAGDPVAERDHARAGQRGQVDDGVGLRLAGQRQAVGQDRAGPRRRC